VDERIKTNLDKWNEVVEVHARAESYNLEGFRRGENVLFATEIEEVGEVRGKSLLHLQCHFGLDTMSWARMGAKVTGLDFSEKAIVLARSLSSELSIAAKFVCANIYDAPSAVRGRFDIVFSSYGAITWLPDLKKWAQVIAHFVKPGGFFYIIDMHPFLSIFGDPTDPSQLRPEWSYFREDVIVDPPGKDYADASFVGHHDGHEWIHPVGAIVNSLIEAGLRIDFFHEFPFCVWQCLPLAERGPDGLWRVKGDPIPLLFSVKATKPK
jgi:SAM-dependent methyltransferase